MDADKENVRRSVKTKIPLPLDPLPAIPKHLLMDKMESYINEKRDPLKTIAQSNVFPSTSSQQEKSLTKPKFRVTIDTKHVTMRKKFESLDWEYNVFKDHDEKSCCDNEDEDKNCKSETYFDVNKQRNRMNERLAITPDKSPILPKSVRNVKRSLKRPHSRELQGLSPACKQESREQNKAKRRLEFEFHGRLNERIQSPDYWKASYMTCMNRDYTDHILNYLLKVERKPLAAPAIPRLSRACIINWLMQINGPSGNPAVIQTACWYLDSVLGAGTIQNDKLQVVAAACYWIAQKLHGRVFLSGKLLKYANYAFLKEGLLAAEMAVLNKLGFPHQPVVPSEFITYLAWWCDNIHPGEIEEAATFLCMSGLMVSKELCQEYPSVIACAAVRNAVLLLRKKDMIVQHCPMYKEAEKKTSSLSHTCVILRRAVRTVADQMYVYKAPLQHYGGPPHYIAQQIIDSVRQ